MFDNSVIPYLEKYSDGVIRSKSLLVFGYGESAVDEMLGDLMNNSKKSNCCAVRQNRAGGTAYYRKRLILFKKQKEMLKPMEEKIISILGDKGLRQRYR